MKKQLMAALMVATMILVAFCAPVMAYDEDDQTVGGATAAGASAYGKTLVFSGTYDFSAQTYATNQVVKLVKVPDGYLVDKVVVSATGLNQIITNTLYKYTTDWASDADAQAFAKTTDASVVHFKLLPTYTAANTNAANVEVTVTTDDEVAGSVDAVSYGFINTLSTNGAPTVGKLRIAVSAIDVAPWLRED